MRDALGAQEMDQTTYTVGRAAHSPNRQRVCAKSACAEFPYAEGREAPNAGRAGTTKATRRRLQGGHQQGSRSEGVRSLGKRTADADRSCSKKEAAISFIGQEPNAASAWLVLSCRVCRNDFQCHPGIETSSSANITMMVAAPRAISASSTPRMLYTPLQTASQAPTCQELTMRYVTTVTGASSLR